MGRVQSRVKHKSGDLSFLSCFNFFGDWEDETMATEDQNDVHFCLLLKSFHPLKEPERIFLFSGGTINHDSRFTRRIPIRVKSD